MSRHYYTLDAMRGIAAIAVAMLHMPRVFPGVELPNAHLAVDFFLQLSGFVIAHAYYKRIHDGMPFKLFLYKRIERLYPTYLVGLLLGVSVSVVAILFGGNGLSVNWSFTSLMCSLIPNIFMLPQIGCGLNGLLFPLNPPMWTIFYELSINLLFFLVFLSLRLRLVSALSALVFFLLFVSSVDSKGLDVGFDYSTFYTGFTRLLFSFSLGVFLFTLAVRPKYDSVYLCILPLLVLAGVLWHPFDDLGYEFVATLIFFPSLVLLGAKFNPGSGKLQSIFLFLGAMSFPLYVIHKPLYQLLYGASIKFAPDFANSLGSILGIVILSVAIFSSNLIANNINYIVSMIRNSFSRQ